MKHTFLFEPGLWTGAGTFWRGDGEPLPAQCRTEVAHRPECWLLSGTLEVLGSPPVEFVNAYWIEPPGKEPDHLKWASENATFGKLQGAYTVVGGAIFSVYRCTAAGYHGAEHYRQIDPETYETGGVLLLEDRAISSWQLRLTRTRSAA